ncbi:MAG: hypothetical protein COT59_00690 [Candidatus Nealsonbacteria bacterium CG09_land_8_20_14_0_10_42_14]|uniref:UDP-N-acetylmuramate--L-alanine ligase n=1 Tax=Candidatus Nealsonbacteria bacterium CG09_land_8_20_14_0_10_42_14 TaxID=1974707 RepID=A0A2H0WXW5_9BACT|nr:MAG: hypothetical protein COT59_00690 [Candidatus Nealsonbacteria bacterium CG09_land_8_20_14_0_10_42_14]
MKKLPKISNGVHFIGIGGIGVSALARYYLAKGHQVSGSDLVASEITQALKKKGAKITINSQLARNVLANMDLVIYSPAVPENNPELKQAKKLGIKCLSYPQALGELTKKHFTIAVCGTHGKSTTTAMIGLLLVKAGLDPTVIVGTKVKEFGNTNCKVGKSKYLVIEADEHFASFLNYWPKIIVLTNIEADHLDYYKNIKNVRRAFKEFISHLPKDGKLITAKKIERKLTSVVKIPGRHNLQNATLALKTARALKIPDRISFKSLSEYRGSWRRFEVRQGKVGKKKITIVSDYGHHPTEIKATLQAAREKWPEAKIWCLYQPHQYQRTYYLFKDFVKVFRQVPIDRIIITDIYDVAGREEKEIKKKTNSKKLIKAINKKWTVYVPKKKILNYLRKNLRGREVVVVMGAGDIYEIDKSLK